MRSRWNVETLKQYVDQRFADELRETERANEVLEQRLDAMNEFREQIRDERIMFVRADSYHERHKALQDKVETGDDRIEARITVIERWQWKMMGALLLVGVILPIITALMIYVLTRNPPTIEYPTINTP